MQLTALGYLLREELAIRAHDEMEGNVLQLLNVRST